MRDLFLGSGEKSGVTLPVRSRATHMQVIGASGTGKTKFLEHLIRQDILAGCGLCLLDPTGNLYTDVVRWCETKGFLGRKPILLFDPASEKWACGFNPLNVAHESAGDLSFHVDAMVKACAAVWGGEDTDRTPLLKRCLRVVFHVLAEKRLTLLEAADLLSATDPQGLREYLTSDIEDFIIRAQWEGFNALRTREFTEIFGSTTNRLMEFLASERIRRIFGQGERVLDLRRVMDEGGMLLVNLSSGRRVSEDNASLLGALLVNDLFLKARGRPKGSRPFYLYVDECSRFVSEDIGRILDEGRQFGLHLILAHQHLAQLKKAGEAVYGAVMTDARTKVVFGGLSPEDAKVMAELVYMGELDFEEAKTSLNKPVTVGHETVRLHNASHSQGGGENWSRSESYGWNDASQSGVTTREGFLFSREEISRQESNTRGKTTTWSDGRGGSSHWSEGNGWSETMVPILKEMPTQVYSLEEQIHRKAAEIHGLRTQEAIVKLPERDCARVRVPRVEEGWARNERVQRFEEQVLSQTVFVRPLAEVAREIKERRLALLARCARATTPPESAEDFLG